MARTILLVGGSGGIGKKLAECMEGWEDCDASRDPFMPEIFNIVPLSSKDMDIRDEWSIRKCLEKYEPLVIINLAMRSHDRTLQKLDLEQVRGAFEVNLFGNLELIHAFANQRRELGKQGSYIYISSVLSTKPVAGAGIYSACKAFNDSIIKTAAIENRKYGIRFNSIQLGYFGAGLCERLPESVKEHVLASTLDQRFGRVQELANLIQYLMSTPYANGQCIPLTGGLELV